MQSPIPIDLIQKLLTDDAKTPQVRIPYRDPGSVAQKRGPLRRVNSSRKCVHKFGRSSCGAETWMTFDGLPYCWIHGIEYLNDTVTRLTDRIEELLKGGNRVTVVGDLQGNDYDVLGNEYKQPVTKHGKEVH